jgi:anti-sigma factor RsiW
MIGRRQRNHRTERDLAKLADGSLTAARRAGVERAVASSTELRAKLSDQHYTLDAVRDVAGERAPIALRARVDMAQQPTRRRARPLRAVAAGSIAAVASATVLALGGGAASAPTVADAAALASRAPVAGVPGAPRGAASLPSPRVAGLHFPYWEDHFGWKAVGSRHDRLDGRTTSTVYYRHGSQLVAYTIVGGSPLKVGTEARASLSEGVAVRTLTTNGRRTVTWLRNGHTCILSGTHTADASLISLATWRS